MKALSFHQPWAELILQGRKTIELRTWRTSFRGCLAVHAGQTVNREACAALGVDPDPLPRGALLGTVEVVEVVHLDRAALEGLRDQHLALRDLNEAWGWRLAGPQRLPAPLPLAGRRQFWDVPDALLADVAVPGDSARGALTAQVPLPAGLPLEGAAYDPELPFELRVLPGSAGYALALYQWPLQANGREPKQSRPCPMRLAELGGDTLRAVTDHVLDALRAAGYRATDLSRERRQPFRLPEEAGLRLGLLFLAARPLARLGRVEAISSGIRTMPSEEAYYWFSKCTGAAAASAQRALRTLLAGE